VRQADGDGAAVSERDQVVLYVRQLTEPYDHTEPYWITSGRPAAHKARHPSLLDQLRHTWRATVGDDAGSGIAASKPPVTIGALDVELRITAASADWVSRVLELPLRDTAEGNIRLLGGRLSDVAAAGLAEAIESWWRWARVETQWDGRPRSLPDPCPYCAQRMLRVAWDVSAAWCSDCGAAWGADEVGVLGAMLDEQRVLRSTHR